MAAVLALVGGLLVAVDALPRGATPAGAEMTDVPVSADALPTVQIDGVVWSQAMARDNRTVYAVGTFKTARPAGGAPGSKQTARKNFVAYDITTGVMTGFDATLNSTVRAVAVAPNGTVYVGGDFTTAKGVARNRIAAFTPAGALITTFKPALNGTVRALVATDTTVYAGGSFTTAAGVARSRLAAFNAANGALLGWNPKAGDQVTAMVLAPDKSRVIVGGKFLTLGGVAAYGLGALDTATGAVLPFAANTVVKDGGSKGAITSLTTDGTSIFGNGYAFGPTTSNFEGTFSAVPETGKITWLEDCHGDSYGTYAVGGVAYVVSHHHDCTRIAAFPQRDTPQRAVAFANAATQKVTRNYVKDYTSFEGQPAPTLLNWFPEIDQGTFTGQGQGAWSITGNGTYLAVGGEFPTVNGKAQQGLVRFAVRSAPGNPNALGPVLTGAALAPALTSPAAGTVTVTFPSNWDRDDRSLGWRVVRDDSTVVSGTAAATFWKLPVLTATDTGVAAGVHRYRIDWVDSANRTASSTTTSITVGGGSNPAPTARFSSSVNDLTVAFDGRGSTDDGSITGYAWAFGDGTTGSGSTVSHPFAAAGNYPATLTVTDNQGATGTVTGTVTVGPVTPPAVFDTFGRTVTGGFGTADRGGAWSATDASTALAVANGAGAITLTKGVGAGAELGSVSLGDADATVDFALSKVPAGASGYVYLDARTSGLASYRAKVTVAAGGTVSLRLVRVVDAVETAMGPTVATGITYTAGTALRLRFAVDGNTDLRAKVWVRSATEPATWSTTTTDAATAATAVGGIGLSGYLSGDVTNGPVTLSVDNLDVVAP